MTATVRETERKYDLDEDTQLPEWSRLPGVQDIVGPEEQRLDAVYFDTARLDLAAAGVTLRRRRGGSDRGWHLKLPVGGDSRDEIRVGFARGEAIRQHPQPPAELVGLTRAFTRGAELVPVAELRTVRHRWRLTDDQGRDLVEIVDDHVTAQTPADPADPSSWREVETELGEHGSPKLLDRLERILGKAGIRRSQAPAKLIRVLGDRVPTATTPTRPERGSSLGEVVLAYLHDQAVAIRDGDSAVRRDLPDAVHQMRVGTRRMRSVLQAYGGVVDRKHTRALTDELKWLAAVLGTDRDLEVLDDRLTRAVADIPDELVLGPVRAQLTRYLAPRRAAARAELIAALDSDRYLALLGAIDSLLAAPPLTPAAGKPARRNIGALIQRSHQRVEAHVRAAERLPQGTERDVQLHDARKAAKQLRYAGEAAVAALGKPAQTLVNRTKEIQELLGDHQDAITSLPVLRELAAQAGQDGGNGFTFGLLYGRADTRLPDSALGPAWKALTQAVGTATS